MTLNFWIIVICSVLYFSLSISAQDNGKDSDGFDDIRLQMEKVNEENCATQPPENLWLPADSITHLIDMSTALSEPVQMNRTDLLHINYMLMRRSFFWSFLLQRDSNEMEMLKRTSLYSILSTVADLSSVSIASSTAVYSPYNTSQPQLDEDKLINRFAIEAARTDHMSKFNVHHFDNDQSFKISEWDKLWFPESKQYPSNSKAQFLATILHANKTKEPFLFFGPQDYDMKPVKYTRPYFDCGRSNKWLVAAATPILANFSEYNLRNSDHPHNVGISVLEIDYERIDINQCPTGEGNTDANTFANTARCKKETTECDPISGYGLKRGGYQCRCKPSYRRPVTKDKPFMGEAIEKASMKNELHNDSFNCIKIEKLEPLPFFWNRAPADVREKYLDEYPEYRNPKTGIAAFKTPKINVHEVEKHLMNVRSCENFTSDERILPIEFSYGANKSFANEMKMAVRLSNFISAYLQLFDSNEMQDQPLTVDQMIAEASALVFGNQNIYMAGIYWEPKRFSNGTSFATIAMKESIGLRKIEVKDLSHTTESFIQKQWYRVPKERISTDFLTKIDVNFDEVRTKLNDAFMDKSSPMFYRAANSELGFWSQPEFNCDFSKRWIITYSVPFFGWNSEKTDVEFYGIVAVSMDYIQMEINQCDDGEDVPNPFKGTHKCDRKSSYCVPIRRGYFSVGSYRCECLKGFEYPLANPITYWHGELMEDNLNLLAEDRETRYDIMKCRANVENSENNKEKT